MYSKTTFSKLRPSWPKGTDVLYIVKWSNQERWGLIRKDGTAMHNVLTNEDCHFESPEEAIRAVSLYKVPATPVKITIHEFSVQKTVEVDQRLNRRVDGYALQINESLYLGKGAKPIADLQKANRMDLPEACRALRTWTWNYPKSVIVALVPGRTRHVVGRQIFPPPDYSGVYLPFEGKLEIHLTSFDDKTKMLVEVDCDGVYAEDITGPVQPITPKVRYIPRG